MAKKFISYSLLTKYDGLIKTWVNQLISDANGDINAVKTLVDTLIGSDSEKSVRTIANEELVKQLIPEHAKEALDTLQEIAAWIQQHPEDVAEINNRIAILENYVGSPASEAVGTEGDENYVPAKAATGLFKKIEDAVKAEADRADAAEKANKALIEAETAAREQAISDLEDALDDVKEDLQGEAYKGVKNSSEDQYVKVGTVGDDNKQELTVTIGSFSTKDNAQVAGLATVQAVEKVITDNQNVTSESLSDLSSRLDTVEGEGEGSIKKAQADAESHADTAVSGLQNTTISSTSGEDIKVTLGGTVGAPTVTVSYDFATDADIDKLFEEESSENA